MEFVLVELTHGFGLLEMKYQTRPLNWATAREHGPIPWTHIVITMGLFHGHR
jgi:hypothetical protein